MSSRSRTSTPRLSIIHRAEEKALYLFIGKRCIKRIARKAIGSDGSKLVEQFYHLFESLLGKKKGKKFIQMILKIACEIAVLVIHRKVPEKALDDFGKALHYQFGQLMEFPNDLRNRLKPKQVVTTNLRTTLASFTRMVEGCFVDLVFGYTRLATIDRIRSVSSTLRRHDNLDLIFDENSSIHKIALGVCKTFIQIAKDHPEFRYGVVRTTYHMKRRQLN